MSEPGRGATKCSAELHSAVSQISNLRGVRRFGARRNFTRPADYKSAIQQIENLRYFIATFPALTEQHQSVPRFIERDSRSSADGRGFVYRITRVG